MLDSLDDNVNLGQLNTYFVDEDGDGFGNEVFSIESCDPPENATLSGGDCDDENDAVFINATEICDNLDNNCDGVVDEGLTQTSYLDADEDGYGNEQITIQSCTAPEGYVGNVNDCNDLEPMAWVGKPEEVCDGVDNNCDIADEGVLNTYYLDGW